VGDWVDQALLRSPHVELGEAGETVGLKARKVGHQQPIGCHLGVLFRHTNRHQGTDTKGVQLRVIDADITLSPHISIVRP